MSIRNDDHIRSFLAEEARRATTAGPSFDDAIRRLAPRVGGRSSGASRRLVVLLAATLLLAAALGTAIAVGSGLVRLPWMVERPDLGIFEAAAGRIVYLGVDGLSVVDPNAPADPPMRIQAASQAGVPLGWSSDGTRLLIKRESSLAVLHADGSEKAVTGQLSLDRLIEIGDATISPDGTRVVFVGLTRASTGGCCNHVLYAVDADGGPAEVLLTSRYGIVEDPTFSPDGTRIAYDDGVGDNNHHIWVVNADGSDAHEIASKDCACHVRGLAWSPAGDRIAIGLEGTIYTFVPNGSEFTAVISGGNRPYWSPDGSRLAYAFSCFGETPIECGFAVAGADGSNARELGFGILGPWHPAVR